MTKRTNRLRSIALIGKAVDKYYEDLRLAPERGQLVAWCDGIPLAFPILRAMDIAYFFGPAYSATISARHLSKDVLRTAEMAGYLPEICSYTRHAMGCALYPPDPNANPFYRMPKPDFILTVDPGCSMTLNWADAERRLFKVPLFEIRTVHIWSGDEEEEAKMDMVRQLKELITFLEDLSHKKLDWERLKKIMAEVKEAALLRNRAMEMCEAVPAPATFFDWSASLGGINYLLGRPECVGIYREIWKEVKERVERKEAAVIGEKYRLYWDGIMCWPKFGHLAEKFASFGACVIAGRYTHLGFYNAPERIDPEKPLEGIAENAIAHHGHHNIDWLVDKVSELCIKYKIDGLICHATRTCRFFAGLQLEMMERVSRRLGIPATYFESDMADETFYSEAQIDTRLQALLETIDSRRS